MKTGYFLSNQTKLFALMELMNETPDPREAVVTVEWEYIPSPVPAEFQQMKSIWLDVAGCGNSEVPVPGGKPNTTFELDMTPAWEVPQDWKQNLIVGLGGHLHDGGTHLMATKNNQSFCDMAATYGAAPEYIDMMANMTGMDMSMPGMNMSGMGNMGGDVIHISNISYCANATSIKPGDKLSVRAFYNTTLHQAMVDSTGTVEPVMGISILYAAQSNDTQPKASAIGVGGSTATATLDPNGAIATGKNSGNSSSKSSAAQSFNLKGGFGSASAAVVMFAAGFVAFFML